jgi:Protein of unknown function (DUF3592)
MLMFDLAMLVPAGAVALGALFAVKAVALRRQGRACAVWPTVAGKIIGSRVDTAMIDNITETDQRGRVRPDEQVSAASVRYGYRVGQRDYQSTRLYLGRTVFSGSPRAAVAVVAKYPPNAAVAVHYNPVNPAEAVLEPLNFANANLAFVMAFGFGGIGLFMLSVMASVLWTGAQ